MLSSLVHFAGCRCGLAALVALSFPAMAQQSIQFSRPANQDPTIKPGAIEPKEHVAPSAFNAPSSLFGSGPSANFDPLPAPATIYPPMNSAQWKAMNDKRNWTLLTPEEILGVPTPEQVLGIATQQEQDDAKLSPEERFLRRQDRQSAGGVTNTISRSESPFWHRDDLTSSSPFASIDPTAGFADPSSRPTAAQLQVDSQRNLNPFFRPTAKSLADMNQGSESAWSSPFGTPLPTPKPTPEQLAGMDRFRALMEPSAPPKPAIVTPVSFQPGATTDPNFQAPAFFNPAGHSYTPLASDITKPTGLAPLPGITGPAPAPPKKAPLVQPPPWLSTSPQNGGFLQRQF